MPTPEQPSPEASPRTNIAEAFRALPLAEQLTALPDILNTALASDKCEKVIHYLETLLAKVVPEHSLFHVSRARVLAIGAYTAEELAVFTDEDFDDIAERIEDHFRQDWINAEIVFHVLEMLEAQPDGRAVEAYAVSGDAGTAERQMAVLGAWVRLRA